MTYPLKTKKDFEEEIQKIEKVIIDLENEPEKVFRRGLKEDIKTLREKIELGKEMMRERFGDQLSFF
jgi:hypothetical protein